MKLRLFVQHTSCTGMVLVNVLAEAGVAGLIDFQGIVAQLLQTTNFWITDAVVERAWLEAQR